MRRFQPDPSHRASLRRPSWWAAQLGLLALAGYELFGILSCLGSCYADIGQLFGPRVAGLSLPDMRLNSWILAWVQRALTRAPASLFDANAFYPAPGGLTGSEHMIGVSLPLLPLAPFAPGAVLLHQLATVLSFLILGWTTFALARWLTQSDWAAFVAAATAMFMPWRIFELAHVQLLSAQWMPLIWLLVGRILTGEAGKSSPLLLAGVLFLQLTSSYYLAYYVTASLVVLVPVLLIRHGVHRKRALRLGAAFVLAYLPFLLVSVPYLARDAASDLLLVGATDPEITLSELWAAMAGRSPGIAEGATRLTYQLPLCVLSLAVMGALLGRLRQSGGARPPEQVASFSIALWLIVLCAVVFLPGDQIRIAGHDVPLPGRLATRWIPGFRHLRTPARWFFLAGIATPVLAAIGLYRARWVISRLAPGARSAALPALRLGALAFIALDMSWETLPVRHAGLAEIAQPYQVLRELPAGVVLEVPWPRSRLREADTGSRYMLASTLHWKPILNGFAPYPPRAYRFLHGLSWRLPQEDVLDRLVRLTGLRWLVIHWKKLSRKEVQAWEVLVSKGRLRPVFEDPQVSVLEVTDRKGAGAWTDALRSRAPRERTLTGLARDPIAVSDSARLEVEVPEALPRGAPREVFVEIEATVENGTPFAWPGLDIQTQGLVQLRYGFVASDGRTVAKGVIPLYADVPAHGRLVTRGLVETPEQPGVYRLRVALAQRRDGGLADLGPAVERWVSVGIARSRG